MLAVWVLLASVAGAAPAVVDAPVTSATVFSDCAQVTRTASLHLSGRSEVAFPILPARVVPSSIRLEATGGEVERITVSPVKEDELPVDETRELLTAIEQKDQQIELAGSERDALAEIHDGLAALTPAQPEPSERAPAPRLDPSGWLSAMAFLAGSTTGLQARLTAIEQRLSELREQRAPLLEKARLLGARHPAGGHRVLATVTGKGPARLALSYEVSGARWYPTYEIQLVPTKAEVAIAFVGLVEQETGEDWQATQLTLSTAIPAHASKLPKLTAWRIGSSERFEPRPVPVRTAVPPPPPPSPRPLRGVDEVHRLRRLLATVGARQPEQPTPGPEEGAPAPPPSPVVPAAAAYQAETVARLAEEEVHGLAQDMKMQRNASHERQRARRTTRRPRPVPRMAVNIAPPAAYRYPRLAANLPAALAAGHDMAFPSAARETVGTGKGARRVALFSQTWPVSVERLVFPALAKQAFLVAQIRNPSKQPLPGGRAHLFVGEDPAGVAQLKFVAPGEKFTLPLGIDQAIKPIRNVTQSTVETGFISKDEVTEYVTVIELSNPHASPLAARVKDQIPVTADKDRVEIKLLSSQPPAKLDPENGELEWRLTIAPGTTVKLRFVYTIKRPKGARLVQQ